MTHSVRPVISIVGGGFAGTALALQLARLPGVLEKAKIHLIESRSAPGPGLAYGTAEPSHLLNVRPGALSVYQDEPAHFANWLARQPEGEDGLPEFASRVTFGRYLNEELAAVLASTAKPQGVQWHHTTALAAPLRPDGRRAVKLADGTEIGSDYVVLALGNFPPAPPVGPDLAYLTHPGYHPDPWAPGHLHRIGPEETVLLIGSGLTAVDMLLSLRQQGHRAPVTVVARHGRWPVAHELAPVPYPNFYPELAGEPTVGGVVKIFQKHRRLAAAQGIGWRAVLDALRPDLGRIWASWPLVEQQRFLRHLASLWGVTRHRSPPQNAATIQQLITDGFVKMHTGRIREIQAAAGADLRVCVQHGHAPATWLTTRHVVNCAGPLLDYQRIQIPLVTSLRDAGHLTPDPLGLGLLTDACGAMLAADGSLAPGLFTLGPSRRPAYFESTAVPELRQQAADLARELARRMMSVSIE